MGISGVSTFLITTGGIRLEGTGQGMGVGAVGGGGGGSYNK